MARFVFHMLKKRPINRIFMRIILSTTNIIMCRQQSTRNRAKEHTNTSHYLANSHPIVPITPPWQSYTISASREKPNPTAPDQKQKKQKKNRHAPACTSTAMTVSSCASVRTPWPVGYHSRSPPSSRSRSLTDVSCSGPSVSSSSPCLTAKASV